MDTSLPFQSLLERLKGATGPDRELDLAIILACGCVQIQPPPFEVVAWPNGRRISVGPHNDRLPITASIDAALALVERVLPGWEIALIRLIDNPWEAIIEPPDCSGEERWRYVDHRGANPALALCVALLQALIASKSPSETGE